MGGVVKSREGGTHQEVPPAGYFDKVFNYLQILTEKLPETASSHPASLLEHCYKTLGCYCSLLASLECPFTGGSIQLWSKLHRLFLSTDTTHHCGVATKTGSHEPSS